MMGTGANGSDVTRPVFVTHCRRRQYKAVLSLLNELLKDNSASPEVWSRVAEVQLALGDIPAAQVRPKCNRHVIFESARSHRSTNHP